MKLIVGLGNPGPEYSETRHNVGFWVADELANRHKVKFKQSAEVAGADGEDHRRRRGEDMLLAEPMTFMNLSGWAVRELRGVLQDCGRRPAGDGRRCGSSAWEAEDEDERIGRRA